VKPDYRRIHRLEFDLGFRDDPPDPVHVWHGMMKDLYMSEPGAVIYYDPKYGRPEWTTA